MSVTLESTLRDSPEPNTDLSLRAEPETYLDRKRESAVILARIETSSASVIGISGVRGAGKSSLALKVLAECDKRNYFTLLIPSPTAYEPQDFLVSLYQRICEAVILRLERLFRQDVTLEVRGKREGAKSRRRFWGLILAWTAILFVTVGYSVFEWVKISAARSSALADARDRQLKDRFEWVRAEISRLKSTLADKAQTPDDKGRAEEQLKYLQRQEQRDLAEEQTWISRRSEDRPATVIYGTMLPSLIATVIVYGSGILVFISARRAMREYRLARRFTKELGLYHMAKERLDHLRYQTTLKDSQEAGATVWSVTGKLVRGRELTTRPVSLPGLTADCCIFLRNAVEALGGKLVICLDELDKIVDTEQLSALLRGVKGIFGQPNTHFLLTVSEDALAEFDTRRGAERGILESAFEEILYLNRVDASIASEIVSKMLRSNPKAPIRENREKSHLFWIFGVGIPREIKRCVLNCFTEAYDIHSDGAIALWRLLYGRLIESLRQGLVLATKQDEADRYNALKLLEEAQLKLAQLPADPNHLDTRIWCRQVIAGWSKSLEAPIFDPTWEAFPTESSAKRRATGYLERCTLELTVGLFALLSHVAHDRDSGGTDASLLEIFSLMSASPLFAAHKCAALLREVGVLEEPEVGS